MLQILTNIREHWIGECEYMPVIWGEWERHNAENDEWPIFPHHLLLLQSYIFRKVFFLSHFISFISAVWGVSWYFAGQIHEFSKSHQPKSILYCVFSVLYMKRNKKKKKTEHRNNNISSVHDLTMRTPMECYA